MYNRIAIKAAPKFECNPNNEYDAAHEITQYANKCGTKSTTKRETGQNGFDNNK